MPWVPVTAGGITIAVTVYDRRDYVLQAIESALAQRKSVKVLVVEDCGPDPGMRSFVEEHFSSRIQYHRNSSRRGLFGNWNVCLELCTTPWISILHDDDYLAPDFVDAMEELAEALPNRGAYFSSIIHVDDSNRLLPIPVRQLLGPFREIDPCALAHVNDVLFPGQLLRVDHARALGGFRETSQFCGDWEMWFKLAYHFGAAQTNRPVAFSRSHEGVERGTNRIVRTGRKHALDFIQAKRNLCLLRKTHPNAVFDRRKMMQESPLPTRDLLQNAATMSPRLVRYNLSLLSLSHPPHWRYRAFQAVARLVGPRFVRALSTLQKKNAARP